MNRSFARWARHLAASLLTALLAGSGAIADDTEIYAVQTNREGSVKPNIVFVIDNSGSMKTDVTLRMVPVPFDPAKTYTGDCPSGRVYWSATDGKPLCTGDNWFSTAVNTCAASTQPLASVGHYTDRAAYLKQASRCVTPPQVWDATINCHNELQWQDNCPTQTCQTTDPGPDCQSAFNSNNTYSYSCGKKTCTASCSSNPTCATSAAGDCAPCWESLCGPAQQVGNCTTTTTTATTWNWNKAGIACQASPYTPASANYPTSEHQPQTCLSAKNDSTVYYKSGKTSYKCSDKDCNSCGDAMATDPNPSGDARTAACQSTCFTWASNCTGGYETNTNTNTTCAGGAGGTSAYCTGCYGPASVCGGWVQPPDDCSQSADYWSALSTANSADPVECAADYGVHGNGATGVTYPADEQNGGPWRADTTSVIDWATAGGQYTLYTSNYLNWYYTYYDTSGNLKTYKKTRLQVVKDAFANLMGDLRGVNAAIMIYNNNDDGAADGGRFIQEMNLITDANYQSYIDTVNALTTDMYTPLAETLWEAYRFYRGDTVDTGNDQSPYNVSGVLDPSTLARSSTGPYKSPIEYACQKNYVVFLTDGLPTKDANRDTSIKALPTFATHNGFANCVQDYGNTDANASCFDDLARYMKSADANTSTLAGTQNVEMFTIGLDVADATQLLTAAATAANEEVRGYYAATDDISLNDAFQSILASIQSVNSTFISPTVAVDSFGRYAHLDQIYVAVFKGGNTPVWPGNLKRYRMDSTGVLRDSLGNAAVDTTTGFFKDTARSWWSTANDGAEVAQGGAASRLTTSRTLYTYTPTTAPSNAALTSATNALHEDNTAITKTMLGDALMTDTDRTAILQYARGVDVKDRDADGNTTEVYQHIGDPLHARPLLVSYGGTTSARDMTVFLATNEGLLHAIDPDDGSEVFAFMPRELLPNIRTFYNNRGADAHPYGLDGPLTMWFNDVNRNGVIYDSSGNLNSGESVYLYQGMRRGGRNYYALDVTNRSAPVYKFAIQGGSGSYSELGQTWSEAIKARIKLNGVARDVLIFTGGYDPHQDGVTTRTADAQGRAIFIADAATGAKLWQAGPSGSSNGGDPNLVLSAMRYSIPSTPALLDVNMDGFVDRLYVGDMGGQLWRVDIDNAGNTGASDLADGGVIADLSGSAAADNRRFYYPPAVTKMGSYLYLAIGSGFRAHPLNTTIQDGIFVVKDRHITDALDFTADTTPADGYPDYLKDYGASVSAPVGLSDLYDTTANLIQTGTAAEKTQAIADLSAKSGWYFWLNNPSTHAFEGEKALAKAIVYDGELMFTTFSPTGVSANSCQADTGKGRFYRVSLIDGTIPEGATNRSTDLKKGGIPSEAVIIVPSGRNDTDTSTDTSTDTGTDKRPVVLVNPEEVGKVDALGGLTRTYWQVIR